MIKGAFACFFVFFHGWNNKRYQHRGQINKTVFCRHFSRKKKKFSITSKCFLFTTKTPICNVHLYLVRTHSKDMRKKSNKNAKMRKNEQKKSAKMGWRQVKNVRKTWQKCAKNAQKTTKKRPPQKIKTKNEKTKKSCHWQNDIVDSMRSQSRQAH